MLHAVSIIYLHAQIDASQEGPKGAKQRVHRGQKGQTKRAYPEAASWIVNLYVSECEGP